MLGDELGCATEYKEASITETQKVWRKEVPGKHGDREESEVKKGEDEVCMMRERIVLIGMNWRAPWLRGRTALISQAALDTIWVAGAYGLTNSLRNGDPGTVVGFGALSIVWVSVSYLIGRYKWNEEEPEAAHKTVGKALIVVVTIAIIVSVSQWGADSSYANTRGRGTILSILAAASIASVASNRIINSLISKRSEWKMLCNELEASVMIREVEKGVPRCSKLEIFNMEDRTTRKEIGCENLAIGENTEIEGIIAARVIEAKSKGAIVTSLVSWCERYLQRVPPELLTDGWIARAEGFSLRNGSTSWRVKRLGDIVVSAVLIAGTLPLVMLAAVAIRVEDGGPVFYKQKRNGLRGRAITIWKLRSMRIDAESGGAQWSRSGDKRVTKVGRIIRSTRIDELPQLISVFNGDLSLIGPRPERPEMDEVLSAVIPNYGMRVWVRPGLSGWAQVCYPYGSSVEDSRNKLSYDIYYLRNYSMALDLMIAIKTIRLVSSFSRILK